MCKKKKKTNSEGPVRAYWSVCMTHMMLLQPRPHLTGCKQLDIWRDVSEGLSLFRLWKRKEREWERDEERGGDREKWPIALWPSRMFKENQKILHQQTSTERNRKNVTTTTTTTTMATAITWALQGEKHSSEEDEEKRNQVCLISLSQCTLTPVKKEPKRNTFINPTKTFSQFYSAACVISLQLWLIFININYKCQSISSAVPTRP